MSDGVFPRGGRPLGFDKMAAAPRPGDRTPRDDDRYLFLEALLAARQRVLITYVGQSISDNTPLPPSAVISELLDALEATFDAGADGMRARVVVRHPLQPFSPRYFLVPRRAGLVSFAHSHFDGAAALQQPTVAPLPFVERVAHGAVPQTLDLDDLIRFLTHPSRWFLQQRLGLYLPDRDALLEEREPDELDTLERWAIGDRVLQLARDGQPPERDAELLRGEGLLPLGAIGDALLAEVQHQARAIASAVPLPSRPPLPLDIAVGDCRLSGTLSDLGAGGLISTQFSKVGGTHELRLWVRHLALSAVEPGAASCLAGRAKGTSDGITCVVFRPVDDPVRQLIALMEIYRQAHDRPPPLFKYASRAFAECLAVKGAGEEKALDDARKQFGPGAQQGVTDCRDVYVAQLYRDAAAALASPPGDAFGFAALATAVYGPLLAHREET
jgi:exodeoxyribonuclease V gamma subunit